MFNKNNPILFFGLFIIATALLSAGCGEKPGDKLDYDRAALNSNLARNIVLPCYEDVKTQLTALQNSQSDFAANATQVNLDALQFSLKTAWLAWEKAEMFEFGPAANLSLRSLANTWPADSGQINSNITAGNWDLNIASNADARGFPALDYLLNGNSDSQLLTLFTTDPYAANRSTYLQALLNSLQTAVNSVLDNWTSNYLATFEANKGTDVGSSAGFFVNQLNYEGELLKNARLGIPLGVMTLGQPLPGHVEANFGGYSVELATQNLNALYNSWRGYSPATGDGYGLDDALDAVEAKYNGSSLSDAINQQFGIAQNALNAVPDPLSNAVSNQAGLVETAYQEVQRLIVLLKTDMASALGILITYTDNDGD